MDNIIMFFIIGGIVVLGLAFVIAEFWGRTKHIGRLWSMLLLLAGEFLVGIIAIAASPKANKPSTKGHNGHLAFGIIFIIISIIMIFSGIYFIIEGQSGYNEKEYYKGFYFIRIGVGLLFSGIYLIQLYRGKIVNHSPRGNANPSTNQQPNNYNNQNQNYNNATPPVNPPTQPNNGGNFYNGGHNATANHQPQQRTQPPQQPQQRKPQGGKGEFNGNLYN